MSDRSTRGTPPPGAADRPASPRDAHSPPFDGDARSVARLMGVALHLHSPGALELGLELRHVRRLVQPVVDAVFAGRDVLASTTEPGDGAAARTTHAAVLAIGVAAELGLTRAEAADLGVVALMHGLGDGPQGVRRLLGSTTWSALSLDVLECSLARPVSRKSHLVAQVVTAATEYVRWSSHSLEDESGETLERALRAAHERWHPEITAALTRVVTRAEEGEQERPAA